MSKIFGLMISLSLAIILIAPQVFAVTGETLYTAPGYYRVDIPEMGGAEYAPAPMAACTVEPGASNVDINKRPNVPEIGHGGPGGSYSESAKSASTCKREGSRMPSNNIKRLDSPGMWQYAVLRIGTDR
jgi:hypothetical protein